MPQDDGRDGDPQEGDLVNELGDGVPTVVTQPTPPSEETETGVETAASQDLQEGGTAGNVVTLRADKRGEDERYLRASLNEDGSLVLEGQDLGPGTAMVSPDGEYEYWITVKPEHFPRLLALLGADPEANLLEVLSQQWTGKKSYELETLITDRVPHGFHSYP